MAETTAFQQIVNVGREAVRTTFEYIGENETPLLKWVLGLKKRLLTEQGYRIPIETRRPGGHTSYDRSNVDFRKPVSLETDSMRTYPIWYALPFKIDGATFRALKRGDADQFMNYARYMKSITAAAMKRLEYYFHDDGSAVLAVAAGDFGGGDTTLDLQTLASSAAGAGGTKGSKRLEVGHIYAVIDAGTPTVVNATFTVTSINSSSQVGVSIANDDAAVAAGDMIVDMGPASNGDPVDASGTAYNKAPMGLRGFCAQTGVLQNIARSDYAELKTPRYNGSDSPITPYAFRFVKDLVNLAANDTNEATGRLVVIPVGQHGALVNQQFGYRRYDSNETVRGVANKYIDADGDTYLMPADAAEDRVYILSQGGYSLGEEKPFGAYDDDGSDIRMLTGVNDTGSDKLAGSIGWGGNLIKEGLPRLDAYMDRLAQTDLAQQISL